MPKKRFNILSEERLIKIIEDMTEVLKNLKEFKEVLEIAKKYLR